MSAEHHSPRAIEDESPRNENRAGRSTSSSEDALSDDKMCVQLCCSLVGANSPTERRIYRSWHVDIQRTSGVLASKNSPNRAFSRGGGTRASDISHIEPDLGQELSNKSRISSLHLIGKPRSTLFTAGCILLTPFVFYFHVTCAACLFLLCCLGDFQQMSKIKR